MITEKTINTADVIRYEATNNDRCLVPVGGSLISSLVDSISPLELQASPEAIARASYQSYTADGSYETQASRRVKGIARVLGNIVDVAKNEINPKIKDILADIDTQVNQQAEWDSGLPRTVVQVELHPLLKDVMFMEMLESFKDLPNLPMESVVDLKVEVQAAFSETGDAELRFTGSPTLDARITDYFKGSSMSFTELLEWKGDRLNEMSQSELTLMFLSLNGVLDGRVSSGDSMLNDPELVVKATVYRSKVGLSLYRSITNMSKLIDGGTLLAMPDDNASHGEVYVYGVNYRKWLKNGGSVEAVMGYYVRYDGQWNHGGGRLLETAPAEFIDDYNRAVAHARNISSIKRKTLTRRVLLKSMGKMITGETDEPNAQIRMQERLHKSVEVDGIADATVELMVRRVVCDVFTDGDEVCIILAHLDNAATVTLNPDGTPNMPEAIYLAVTQMVAEWIASQIKHV